MDQFYASASTEALYFDASNWTHSISVNIKQPKDIELIFDKISYEKGASIIRMLQSWLDQHHTETLSSTYFQRGLQNYLNSHAYGNAVTQDLWTSLEEEGVKDGWLQKGKLPRMMNSWTNQIGFPLVRLNVKSSNQMTLTQERFYCCGERDASTAKQLWSIPLTYGAVGGNASERTAIIFDTKETSIAVEASDRCSDLVLVNFGHVGFYRTLYPEAHLEKLISCFQQQPNDYLSQQDLTGFADDVFQLTLAGLYPVRHSLKLLDIILSKRNYGYGTAEVALGYVETLAEFTELESFHTELSARFLTYLRPRLEKTVWTIDDRVPHVEQLLRSRLITVAVSLNDEATLKTAQSYFNVDNVDPSLLTPIYDAAIINGNSSTYDWMVNRYKTSPSASEQRRALLALAAARDPSLIERTLLFATTSVVRNQDAASLVNRVATQTLLGRRLTWPSIRDHWDSYMQRYGQGNSQFNRVLEMLVKTAYDQNEVQEIIAWVEAKYPYAKMSVLRGKERVLARWSWINSNRDALAMWLKQ